MMYFWAPPDPGDHKHHERFEMEEFEDTWFVLGLGLGIWGVYWLIVHYVDHFTFNKIAWYFEIASFIPAVIYLMISEEYGVNPLKWWPMWFGYSVECKEKTLFNERQIKKLGGPFNVYQVSTETLKFRTKKDAFRYTMF